MCCSLCFFSSSLRDCIYSATTSATISLVSYDSFRIFFVQDANIHTAGTDVFSTPLLLHRFIMFATMRSHVLTLSLSYLLLPAAARVIWIPEEFDPHAERNIFTKRQEDVCGGDTSLFQCLGGLPSDFCCPKSTTCVHINTSSTAVTAAICCPAGQDCSSISPVDCDINMQNATTVPGSQLHSDPPKELTTCGSACCPMGYSCQDNRCIASNPTIPASSASSSNLASTSTPLPSSSSTPASGTSSTTSSASTSKNTAGDGYALGDPQAADSQDAFNGKSFAAGFIPGIAIGALIAACLILLIFRRKRRNSVTYVDEKRKSRDTLTDLSTWRPTMHGRSISEPQADPSRGYRTDFLRGTPPRGANPADTKAYGNSVDVRSPASGPATTPSRTPKIKALFSRSPFMNQTPSTPQPTQPPVPAHLKRGTLSFTISPVRALKKQKSMHSLRRQMTDASRNTSSRNNSQRRAQGRSMSTETIQVLMPSNEPYTPERPPFQPTADETLSSTKYQPHESASTFTSIDSDDTPDERQPAQPQAAYASSSRYPSEVPVQTTPTRPPLPRQNNAGAGAGALGSPYTPTANQAGGSKAKATTGGGLAVPRNPNDARRDTTFSAMMERAGLRRSDLVMGNGKK